MVPRATVPRPPELPRDVSTHSKASVPESSHSNEADDEQSSSELTSQMEDQSAPPLYEGEDTRLTSDKELSGFYMYGWAAEVFVVCGIGSFIPVTLEQLARENGVLLSDRTTPCHSSFDTTPPSSSIWTTSPSPNSGQCIITLLGLDINTASFAMYTFSLSVLLQALLIISISGAADHGRFRKTFLISFAFIGSTATMLFLPVVPKLYILAAVLAIIANTCFGASFVLLNSFLPLLVRYHPTVQYADISNASSFLSEEDEQQTPTESRLSALSTHYSTSLSLSQPDGLQDSTTDASAPLLARPSVTPSFTIPARIPPPTTSRELSLSTKISSYGIAIGYTSALLVQTASILLIILFQTPQSPTFSLRLVLFLIGAWWFTFSIPTSLWLRPRPGPPLHLTTTQTSSTLRTGWSYFTYSWSSLLRTAKHARQLKDVLLFLGAWFLLSDSIATVSGTAVLFAKTSLSMSAPALALINIIATLTGILGAFAWPRISVFFHLSPTQTILACILLFELIPIYGLLGYIPAIQRLGYLGLQVAWEMYVLGAVYGFVLGGLSSYCRSVFGELVPMGFEAQFFALFAITDKGSSIFGPAIVGLITDACGEIRPAFWFLAVLIGLPFPIMMLVDVERGKEEGMALARELEELGKSRDEREERRRVPDLLLDVEEDRR